MLRGLMTAVGGGLIVLMCIGCQTVRKIEVKSYLQEKPRLDQNRDAGNSGYLMGAPAEIQEYKPTRKVIVVEMTKPLDEADDILIEEETTTTTAAGPSQAVVEEETITTKTIEYPEFGDKEFFQGEDLAIKEQQAKLIEYTVEKDDTLQKISKKFYDSYTKWPRIYDANRDAIGDPDFLKPGIKLFIPVDQ